MRKRRPNRVWTPIHAKFERIRAQIKHPNNSGGTYCVNEAEQREAERAVHLLSGFDTDRLKTQPPEVSQMAVKQLTTDRVIADQARSLLQEIVDLVLASPDVPEDELLTKHRELSEIMPQKGQVFGYFEDSDLRKHLHQSSPNHREMVYYYRTAGTILLKWIIRRQELLDAGVTSYTIGTFKASEIEKEYEVKRFSELQELIANPEQAFQEIQADWTDRSRYDLAGVLRLENGLEIENCEQIKNCAQELLNYEYAEIQYQRELREWLIHNRKRTPYDDPTTYQPKPKKPKCPSRTLAK
ncbi:MAG TPA: hypothetical protein VJJ80_01685 [Patescibacteria group bacterium]|nr:hypothetical protein [Patescibacteria group bacterium]